MDPGTEKYVDKVVVLRAQFEADARALWAVRVLDAWAEHEASYWRSGCGWCDLVTAGGQIIRFRGIGEPNADDAARLAAAEAVFPELPESERAKLGERP